VKNTEIKECREFSEKITEYILPDELKITNIFKYYRKYKAYEWVTYFENTSDKESRILSNICDCDAAFVLDEDTQITPGFVAGKNAPNVITVEGANLTHTEFCTQKHYMIDGQTKIFSCIGGRSSSGLAPFFDINQNDKGILAAIGWTGQWQAEFERRNGEIIMKTGIENARFRLLPKEKIRTSSIVLFVYENGQNHGHNRFRRFVKDYFSIIGQSGRADTAPLSTMIWGSMPTAK